MLAPCCRTSVLTVARPSPVPCPCGLVVKKGSKIRARVAHAFPGLIDTPRVVGARIVDDMLECALVASSHRLSSKPSVSTWDLANEPFLFVARPFHPAFYDAVMESFRALDFSPRVDATYDGLRTLWALAATGAGWTIGSRRQCAAPPEGLVGLKIEDFQVPWGLELLWRRDESREAIRGAVSAILARMAESRG